MGVAAAGGFLGLPLWQGASTIWVSWNMTTVLVFLACHTWGRASTAWGRKEEMLVDRIPRVKMYPELGAEVRGTHLSDCTP